MATKEKQSALFKCPKCRKTEKIRIPQHSCMAFLVCSNCRQLIRAPKGECCVICAYSNKKCPVSLNKKYN